MVDRMRILYVCSQCDDDGNQEFCGHSETKTLRVLPDGRWVCDGCYDEMDTDDVGLKDDQSKPPFLSWPAPPEYVPAHATEKEDRS